MKTTTHFKFIQWRDPKGLHEDSMQTLSDLKFLKDELQFLNNLVSDHTLELLFGKFSIENKSIFSQLDEHKNKLEKLLVKLEVHCDHLQILLDEEDVPNEIRNYKDDHYKLMLEEINVHTGIKKTKRIIFTMLSRIMKTNKQKKLS